MASAYHGTTMKPRTALLALFLAASPLAFAESADPPERILRLGLIDGTVEFHPAAVTNVVTPGDKRSLPTAPLVPGDRLDTGRDSRAELALDTASIRLSGNTRFKVVELHQSDVRLGLERGTASLIVRELYENETLAIATPQTTVTIRQPGEYRLDVTADGVTDISVHEGAAEAQSAGGAVRIAGGQRALLAGTDAYATLVAPRASDGFDEWVLNREVQLADTAPARDGDDEGDYRALDDYGDWVDEPQYGSVWMPSYAYGGYDPLSYGVWTQVSYGGYGGYAWQNPMPWGYYTGFGYGHWTYLHDRGRWCWVPPRHGHQPGYHGPDYTAPYGHPRGNPRNDADRQPVVTTRDLPRRYEGWGIPSQRGNDTPHTPTRVVLSKPPAKPGVKNEPTPVARPVRPQSSGGGNGGTVKMTTSQARNEARGETPSQTVKPSGNKTYAPRQVP